MQQLSFETLILPAEFYSRLLLLCIELAFVVCVIMVVASVIMKHMGSNWTFPLMWYVNMMKIAISILIVGLVFFYDYKTGTVKLTDFQNMYVSTYLVGLLAVVEILSGIASIINDICNMVGANKS